MSLYTSDARVSANTLTRESIPYSSQDQQEKLPFENCACGFVGEVAYDGGILAGQATCPQCGGLSYDFTCRQFGAGFQFHQNDKDFPKHVDITHRRWRCPFCNEWHEFGNPEANVGRVTAGLTPIVLEHRRLQKKISNIVTTTIAVTVVITILAMILL